MALKPMLQSFARQLGQWQNPPQYTVAVGFDGYVDRIHKVVHKKVENQNQYYRRIDQFATHVASLSGRSGQIELALQETKIGGNAPIMAQALSSLGIRCCCMGTLGWPQPDPVFGPLQHRAEVISVAPPAQTDAYEFDDGKLIFSECGTFAHLNWSYLKEVVGLDTLKNRIEQSQLFAAVDWVNLPGCSSIWQGILEEIVQPGGLASRHYFFDLADPSRKSAAEILAVLEIISAYYPYGQVTLGLNETEAREVYAALRSNREEALANSLKEIGEWIFGKIRVHTLLIHPVDHSEVFTADRYLHVPGRVVAQPKILTGGGDNLNAGFCLGLLSGLPLEQTMLLGMATSGAYVQNGYSPSLSDLISYLEQWAGELHDQDHPLATTAP